MTENAQLPIIDHPSDRLYLSSRTVHHVTFGGLGGDLSQVIITSEAWEDMGRPDEIQVTAAPVTSEEN